MGLVEPRCQGLATVQMWTFFLQSLGSCCDHTMFTFSNPSLLFLIPWKPLVILGAPQGSMSVAESGVIGLEEILLR